jgi:hypothetical protein
VSHAIFLRSILTSFKIYSRSFSAAQQGSLFAVMASSSTLDDQVVSRAPIILENQSDWKLWYSLKKQFATVKGVWEYCDPSTTKQPSTVDEEPLDSDSEGKWRKWEIRTNAQWSTLKAIDERHKFLALCDVYRKARESLYEALRGCQGTNYARSRERYQWTIHSFQQLLTRSTLRS